MITPKSIAQGESDLKYDLGSTSTQVGYLDGE